MTPGEATGRRMLLVLGMHRSGTSAVAGMLAQLGVDFSENLVPPAPDNPKGFFEHADVWQLDHAILEALGSAWDDPLPLPPDWRAREVVTSSRAGARAILERDFAASPLAGIKDPRMCRLLAPWRDWLRDGGLPASAVLVVRRPVDVLASLARRDLLLPDQAAWIWLRHTLESERDSRGLPRIVVGYADVMANWRGETARIAAALDLRWPTPPEAAAPQIDGFLDRGLAHHRGAPGDSGLSGPLADWVARAHAALIRPAGIDVGALDEVAAQVARADQVAAAGGVVLRAARLRGHELDRKLEWFDHERRGLVAGNEDLRANLARHVEELRKTKLGAAQLRANLEHHIEDLAALKTELATVYASRSWRITRPVRVAARMARRMLHRVRPAPVTPASAPVPPGTPVVRTAPGVAPARAPTGAPAVPVATREETDAALAAAFARATGPRILIVTPDILGPIRNGGIGTAFAALAQTLAAAGRAVTILYTLGGHTEGGEAIEHWQRHYAGLGVRFVPTWLERGEPKLDAPHHAWRAYRVYLWLKAHQADYDLAWFPEWKGEAYYALQARRIGLDFARLAIGVITHSSTAWADSGNYVLPQKFDDLLLEFLERRSTEMADAVVSPSRYMLDWMHRQGWRWSAPAHVIQNLMPGVPADAVPADAASAGDASFEVTEWVFFGRLEHRKGLLIFLDALQRLPAEIRGRVRITFLGKAIRTRDFDSEWLIRERLAGWPEPTLITDYGRDEALAYLAQPGRVAIIASLVENSPYTVLECVLQRIPFVAANVGGIAELVHPADRARALFQPTPASLAQTLAALDGANYRAPRAASAPADTRQRWIDLQDELVAALTAPPVEPAAPPPHITVCLVHYDRPHLLAEALDSLRQQTYGHFDVVLVDDGSPSQAAREYLADLETEFAWRGWTLVRQPNAYLGAARNHAARVAKGDYVLFMDDDNLARPDELALFARAARVTGADILTTVSDVFSDAEATPQPGRPSRELWIPLGNARGLGVFRNVFGDANALIRRETFLSLGGFSEDYGVGHEDWEFFAKAVIAGANLQLVPEPLFWYRVNAKSMLRGGNARVDHARSVRPYREGLGAGIGPALAYAAFLHHRPAGLSPSGSDGVVPASRSGRAWLLATGMFRPHVRARLRAVLREAGWRGVASRLARYLGRARTRG